MKSFEQELVINQGEHSSPPDRLTYLGSPLYQITHNRTGSDFVERRLNGENGAVVLLVQIVLLLIKYLENYAYKSTEIVQRL